MRPKIYVGPHSAPELVRAVESAGGEVVEKVSEAEAVVWYGGPPSKFAEVDHPGLRWVQLPSAGVEGWFEADAFTPGKVYTSVAAGYNEAVAEQALALILAGVRQLHLAARSSTWQRLRAGTLFGKTVGIVGAGGIGRELIRVMEPFGVEVLAVTRSGTPVPGASLTVMPDRLDEVLPSADFVVVGAPATPETQHMIGAKELASMKPTAWIVNIARGSLIDTDALVSALNAGTIAGAALDVTDPEPLPDGHPLWSAPNVLITSHTANPGELYMAGLTKRISDNVRRFAEGDDLLGIIDIDRGY